MSEKKIWVFLRSTSDESAFHANIDGDDIVEPELMNRLANSGLMASTIGADLRHDSIINLK